MSLRRYAVAVRRWTADHQLVTTTVVVEAETRGEARHRALPAPKWGEAVEDVQRIGCSWSPPITCPECGAATHDFTFGGQARSRILHANTCTAALDWLLHGDAYYRPAVAES